MTDAMGRCSWLSPPRQTLGPRWPPRPGNTPALGTVSGQDGGGGPLQHHLAHEAPRTHQAQAQPPALNSPHLPALTPVPPPAWSHCRCRAHTQPSPAAACHQLPATSLGQSQPHAAPPSPPSPFRFLAKRSDIPWMSLSLGNPAVGPPFPAGLCGADLPGQGWVWRSSVSRGNPPLG